MWQQNRGANFCIVFHSNHGLILRSFRDITREGQCTTDERTSAMASNVYLALRASINSQKSEVNGNSNAERCCSCTYRVVQKSKPQLNYK